MQDIQTRYFRWLKNCKHKDEIKALRLNVEEIKPLNAFDDLNTAQGLDNGTKLAILENTIFADAYRVVKVYDMSKPGTMIYAKEFEEYERSKNHAAN